MKVVHKPWGKEVWLELNDKYCYKRIYINAGHRTSYQYHLKKLETNYLIDGKAEVWLENEEGVVEKSIMSAGDFFTVIPPRKHRVIALTDIILQEVSTPEVDDVVRIQDDTKREDGRLEHEHMKPALCIVCAGKGSRMGTYSNLVNKGLLPIENKAVISHIIDSMPKEYDIVIALGHLGNQIREYCKAVHADRSITFVDVEDYEGAGTGPGTSLLACKDHLKRPFYFITADCLIKGKIPDIANWLAVKPTSIPEAYSTVNVDGENVIGFMNKSKGGYDHAFTGFCAILNYDIFWKELEENIGQSGEMVSAFYNIGNYPAMGYHILDWYDLGTIENYSNALSELTKEKFGIPKSNGQFLYKIDGKIAKMFQENVSSKVKRAKILEGLAPKILYEGDKIFSYEWIEGTTLYESKDKYLNFFKWAEESLWKKEDVDIKAFCYEFYKEKTTNRLQMFLDKKTSPAAYLQPHTINGERCRPISEYMEKINWEDICNTSIATKIYHGDLQFDNVIVSEEGEFRLIDWRDTFGSQSEYGDVYYDLAKLYGGLIMNYSYMKSEQNYSFYKNDKDVRYTFKQDQSDLEIRSYFKEWATRQGFDFEKIRKITALIYLNMSPLHENGFDDLLFFHSISLMEKIYGENK